MVLMSTAWPLKRLNIFSTCCIAILSALLQLFFICPGDEKEPVLVRVFQRDEATTPAFVRRRRDNNSLFLQLPVISVNIPNSDEEVCAATAPQHRFELLHQCEPQASGAQGRHRRL